MSIDGAYRWTGWHASRGTTPECLLKPTLPLSQSIAGIRDHSKQFKVTSANIKSPASKDLEFTSTALKEPEVTTTNIRRSPVPYGSGEDGSRAEELGVTTTNTRPSQVPYGSVGDGSHSEELGVTTTNTRPSLVPYGSGGDGSQLRETRCHHNKHQTVSGALWIRWRRQSFRGTQCRLNKHQAVSSAGNGKDGKEGKGREGGFPTKNFWLGACPQFKSCVVIHPCHVPFY